MTIFLAIDTVIFKGHIRIVNIIFHSCKRWLKLLDFSNNLLSFWIFRDISIFWFFCFAIVLSFLFKLELVLIYLRDVFIYPNSWMVLNIMILFSMETIYSVFIVDFFNFIKQKCEVAFRLFIFVLISISHTLIVTRWVSRIFILSSSFCFLGFMINTYSICFGSETFFRASFKLLLLQCLKLYFFPSIWLYLVKCF
jgi:hypothetical protein